MQSIIGQQETLHCDCLALLSVVVCVQQSKARPNMRENIVHGRMHPHRK